MDKSAVAGYAEALIASVTIQVIIPLVMFGMMLAAFWYLLHKAQKKADFRIEQIFTDADGKTSGLAVVTLMAFAYSVWFMTVLALSGKTATQEFLYFLVFWSGAPVAVVLANKWDGRLPWAKGPDSPGG